MNDYIDEIDSLGILDTLDELDIFQDLDEYLKFVYDSKIELEF